MGKTDAKLKFVGYLIVTNNVNFMVSISVL